MKSFAARRRAILGQRGVVAGRGRESGANGRRVAAANENSEPRKVLRRREEVCDANRDFAERFAPGSRERLAPATEPNQRWSMDFVSDTLENGRTIRVLTAVDSSTC